MNQSNGPKMSNIMWGIAHLGALTIDFVQGLLTMIGIGVIANRVLNPAIGGFWYLFFRMKGIRYTKKGQLQKGRITTVGIIFLIELSGIGDFLPGWTTQVFTTMLNELVDTTASKMDAVSSVLRAGK